MLTLIALLAIVALALAAIRFWPHKSAYNPLYPCPGCNTPQLSQSRYIKHVGDKHGIEIG